MLKISGGIVYDPARGVRGEVRDVFVEGEKVVAPPPPGTPSEVLDVTGLLVTPGAVDLHTHVAGPAVTAARVLCPEVRDRDAVRKEGFLRSGTGGTVPSIFVTGYRYCAMGYTTVCEAAAPPLQARHVHQELADLPLLDKACYVLVSNDYFVMKAVSRGAVGLLRDYVGWVVQAAGGYALKVVNPGGQAALDTPVPPFGVTPREILSALQAVNEELGLPHPIHVHCPDLGRPGNVQTTLETMRTLAGRRAHFAHVQFHAYGATADGGFRSEAPALAEFLNGHPEFTADLGQVVFGPAVTVTADAPLGRRLHSLTGGKGEICALEGVGEGAVVPLVYRKTAIAHTVQWATGLELALLVENPWQLFLSTDHPNGGPFTAYPWVIRLLMDPAYRRVVWEEVAPRLRRLTLLGEIDRARTFEEILIMTRAGPARALGLNNKGHLGPGADADITIYRPQKDAEAMFGRPAYVFKSGRLVAKDGEIVGSVDGKTFLVRLPGCGNIPRPFREEFSRYYTVSPRNYPVTDEYVARPEVIACG